MLVRFYLLHKIASYQPTTESFQGALPHLPLPAVADTMQRVKKTHENFDCFFLNFTLGKCEKLKIFVNIVYFHAIFKKKMLKHLRSMRPILADKEYDELVQLSERFQKGLGIRLQRYLWLKSWLSTNYVTDWWEKFIYLIQREPIMINSNYCEPKII